MSARRKLLLCLGGIPLAGLVLLILGSWYLSIRLTSPAPQRVGRAPEDLPVEPCELQTTQGTKLAAWSIPASESLATVILLHPNRSSRRSMLGRARLFHDAGYHVIMIDFQGHGESEGNRITAGWLERHDVNAVVSFAKTRFPDLPIGIVGRSLGGAATLYAEPEQVDAVILESVYSTISLAVRNRLAMKCGPCGRLLEPFLTWHLERIAGVSADQLKPVDAIGGLSCPTLILAGSLDEHTTVEESRRLHAGANQPSQLIIFEGAKHEDLHEFDTLLYEQTTLMFFEKHLTGSVAD